MCPVKDDAVFPPFAASTSKLPRKKTSRACVHCHKSHMTCETARPCHRCISKGIQDTCVDVPRKKKKYLIDVDDGQLGSSWTSSSSASSKFSSAATNSEYAVLTNITKDTPTKTTFDSSISSSRDSSSPGSISTPTPMNFPPSLYEPKQQFLFEKNVPMHRSLSSYEIHPQWDSAINQYFIGFVPGMPDDKPYLTYPDIYESIAQNAQKQSSKQPKSALSLAIGVQSEESFYYIHQASEWGLQFKEPEEIYRMVAKPFSYTQGFHLLLVYLRKRFSSDKKVLVQLAKSMAEYRPSFTAQVMTLKEEDLIFMEQCFQRTLLEYSKYLAISGTPTMIWRRTGQISFVSNEFTMLTGWSASSLLSRITFVVELMEDQTVIEYFKLFSKIAYEDSKGAGTMRICRLWNPEGTKLINTRTIWTLKRDVFGIPMMIIGNFLPLMG